MTQISSHSPDLKKVRKFLSAEFPLNSDWEFKKVAGDASFRSYYRVSCSDSNWKTKILMFAPVGLERLDHFILIDNFLVSLDLSAPRIIAIEEDQGLLLLEDFGDLSFSKALKHNPELEPLIYKSAIDVLLFLQNFSLPKIEVPLYSNEVLFTEVMLFVDWYLPMVGKKPNLKWRSNFKFYWFNLFDMLNKTIPVLVLRDYHADNLMILKDKEGIKSVGLLDFQDALIGSPAYDLVSLLEDARRDVADKVKSEMLEYFLSEVEKKNLSTSSKEIIESFVKDFEILSLQRNLKILGIFARLSMRDGKNQYLRFLPRVKNLVLKRLSVSKIFDESFKKEIEQMI